MKSVLLPYGISLLILFSSAAASDTGAAAIRERLEEIAEMSAVDRPTASMTEEYMRYFAAAPTLLPANGEAIHGREAIAEFYNSAFDGIRILSNKYEQPVIVVNGSMASVRYIGTAVFQLADQEEAVTSTNRYLDVFVNEDDEWKILWHSWVSVTWE